MRARVIVPFNDRTTGAPRDAGEVFECSKERFEQLTATKWGALVEAVKDERKKRTKED